jgi:hypothetical protein
MNLSHQTREILCKYPIWQEKVEESALLQSFKFDYIPAVIEMFDQEGLLCGIACGQVYETHRLKKQPTEFVAWCLDGQLGLFYVGNEIVVNRLSLMAQAFAILHNALKAV